MYKYTKEDRILTSGELVAKLKSAGGYINLEEGTELISFKEGHVAELHQGSKLLGAFVIHEGRLQCMRPFYWDEVEDAPVCTIETYGVTLDYAKLGVSERITAFNQAAVELVEKANSKGFDVGSPFEIKSLERFKTK